MEFSEYLKKLSACSDAIEWAGDKTAQEAWNTCERGDWMLWLLKKADLCDLRKLTLIKVECAELVKHLMKDERSLNALKVARAFAQGNATEQELSAAAAAAYAAAADDAYTVDAAAYAAAHTAHAAAAHAAAYTAALRGETLKICADICRKHISEINLILNK